MDCKANLFQNFAQRCSHHNDINDVYYFSHLIPKHHRIIDDFIKSCSKPRSYFVGIERRCKCIVWASTPKERLLSSFCLIEVLIDKSHGGNFTSCQYMIDHYFRILRLSTNVAYNRIPYATERLNENLQSVYSPKYFSTLSRLYNVRYVSEILKKNMIVQKVIPDDRNGFYTFPRPVKLEDDMELTKEFVMQKIASICAEDHLRFRDLKASAIMMIEMEQKRVIKPKLVQKTVGGKHKEVFDTEATLKQPSDMQLENLEMKHLSKVLTEVLEVDGSKKETKITSRSLNDSFIIKIGEDGNFIKVYLDELGHPMMSGASSMSTDELDKLKALGDLKDMKNYRFTRDSDGNLIKTLILIDTEGRELFEKTSHRRASIISSLYTLFEDKEETTAINVSEEVFKEIKLAEMASAKRSSIESLKDVSEIKPQMNVEIDTMLKLDSKYLHSAGSSFHSEHQHESIVDGKSKLMDKSSSEIQLFEKTLLSKHGTETESVGKETQSRGLISSSQVPFEKSSVEDPCCRPLVKCITSTDKMTNIESINGKLKYETESENKEVTQADSRELIKSYQGQDERSTVRNMNEELLVESVVSTDRMMTVDSVKGQDKFDNENVTKEIPQRVSREFRFSQLHDKKSSMESPRDKPVVGSVVSTDQVMTVDSVKAKETLEIESGTKEISQRVSREFKFSQIYDKKSSIDSSRDKRAAESVASADKLMAVDSVKKKETFETESETKEITQRPSDSFQKLGQVQESHELEISQMQDRKTSVESIHDKLLVENGAPTDKMMTVDSVKRREMFETESKTKVITQRPSHEFDKLGQEQESLHGKSLVKGAASIDKMSTVDSVKEKEKFETESETQEMNQVVGDELKTFSQKKSSVESLSDEQLKKQVVPTDKIMSVESVKEKDKFETERETEEITRGPSDELTKFSRVQDEKSTVENPCQQPLVTCITSTDKITNIDSINEKLKFETESEAREIIPTASRELEQPGQVQIEKSITENPSDELLVEIVVSTDKMKTVDDLKEKVVETESENKEETRRDRDGLKESSQVQGERGTVEDLNDELIVESTILKDQIIMTADSVKQKEKFETESADKEIAREASDELKRSSQVQDEKSAVENLGDELIVQTEDKMMTVDSVDKEKAISSLQTKIVSKASEKDDVKLISENPDEDELTIDIEIIVPHTKFATDIEIPKKLKSLTSRDLIHKIDEELKQSSSDKEIPPEIEEAGKSKSSANKLRSSKSNSLNIINEITEGESDHSPHKELSRDKSKDNLLKSFTSIYVEQIFTGSVLERLITDSLIRCDNETFEFEFTSKRTPFRKLLTQERLLNFPSVSSVRTKTAKQQVFKESISNVSKKSNKIVVIDDSGIKIPQIANTSQPAKVNDYFFSRRSDVLSYSEIEETKAIKTARQHLTEILSDPNASTSAEKSGESWLIYDTRPKDSKNSTSRSSLVKSLPENKNELNEQTSPRNSGQMDDDVNRNTSHTLMDKNQEIRKEYYDMIHSDDIDQMYFDDINKSCSNKYGQMHLMFDFRQTEKGKDIKFKFYQKNESESANNEKNKSDKTDQPKAIVEVGWCDPDLSQSKYAIDTAGFTEGNKENSLEEQSSKFIAVEPNKKLKNKSAQYKSELFGDEPILLSTDMKTESAKSLSSDETQTRKSSNKASSVLMKPNSEEQNAVQVVVWTEEAENVSIPKESVPERYYELTMDPSGKISSTSPEKNIDINVIPSNSVQSIDFRSPFTDRITVTLTGQNLDINEVTDINKGSSDWIKGESSTGVASFKDAKSTTFNKQPSERLSLGSQEKDMNINRIPQNKSQTYSLIKYSSDRFSMETDGKIANVDFRNPASDNIQLKSTENDFDIEKKTPDRDHRSSYDKPTSRNIVPSSMVERENDMFVNMISPNKSQTYSLIKYSSDRFSMESGGKIANVEFNEPASDNIQQTSTAKNINFDNVPPAQIKSSMVNKFSSDHIGVTFVEKDFNVDEVPFKVVKASQYAKISTYRMSLISNENDNEVNEIQPNYKSIDMKRPSFDLITVSSIEKEINEQFIPSDKVLSLSKDSSDNIGVTSIGKIINADEAPLIKLKSTDSIKQSPDHSSVMSNEKDDIDVVTKDLSKSSSMKKQYCDNISGTRKSKNIDVNTISSNDEKLNDFDEDFSDRITTPSSEKIINKTTDLKRQISDKDSKSSQEKHTDSNIVPSSMFEREKDMFVSIIPPNKSQTYSLIKYSSDRFSMESNERIANVSFNKPASDNIQVTSTEKNIDLDAENKTSDRDRKSSYEKHAYSNIVPSSIVVHEKGSNVNIIPPNKSKSYSLIKYSSDRVSIESNGKVVNADVIPSNKDTTNEMNKPASDDVQQTSPEKNNDLDIGAPHKLKSSSFKFSSDHIGVTFDEKNIDTKDAPLDKFKSTEFKSLYSDLIFANSLEYDINVNLVPLNKDSAGRIGVKSSGKIENINLIPSNKIKSSAFNRVSSDYFGRISFETNISVDDIPPSKIKSMEFRKRSSDPVISTTKIDPVTTDYFKAAFKKQSSDRKSGTEKGKDLDVIPLNDEKSSDLNKDFPDRISTITNEKHKINDILSNDNTSVKSHDLHKQSFSIIRASSFEKDFNVKVIQSHKIKSPSLSKGSTYHTGGTSGEKSIITDDASSSRVKSKISKRQPGCRDHQNSFEKRFGGNIVPSTNKDSSSHISARSGAKSINASLNQVRPSELNKPVSGNFTRCSTGKNNDLDIVERNKIKSSSSNKISDNIRTTSSIKNINVDEAPSNKVTSMDFSERLSEKNEKNNEANEILSNGNISLKSIDLQSLDLFSVGSFEKDINEKFTPSDKVKSSSLSKGFPDNIGVTSSEKNTDIRETPLNKVNSKDSSKRSSYRASAIANQKVNASMKSIDHISAGSIKKEVNTKSILSDKFKSSSLSKGFPDNIGVTSSEKNTDIGETPLNKVSQKDSSKISSYRAGAIATEKINASLKSIDHISARSIKKDVNSKSIPSDKVKSSIFKIDSSEPFDEMPNEQISNTDESLLNKARLMDFNQRSSEQVDVVSNVQMTDGNVVSSEIKSTDFDKNFFVDVDVTPFNTVTPTDFNMQPLYPEGRTSNEENIAKSTDLNRYSSEHFSATSAGSEINASRVPSNNIESTDFYTKFSSVDKEMSELYETGRGLKEIKDENTQVVGSPLTKRIESIKTNSHPRTSPEINDISESNLPSCTSTHSSEDLMMEALLEPIKNKELELNCQMLGTDYTQAVGLSNDIDLKFESLKNTVNQNQFQSLGNNSSVDWNARFESVLNDVLSKNSN